MYQKFLIAGSLALLTLSCAGCGGSGGSGSIMTTTQASTAYSYVFDALAEAGGALDVNRSAPILQLSKEESAGVQKAILNGTRNPVTAQLVSPVLNALSETTVTMPTYTFSCPSGGSIVVNGSFSESGTTTFTESESVVETINSCKFSGITMNGDPNISISVTGTDNGTTTTLNLTMTGGLSVGSATCTTDLTINASANDTTGSGSETYSGSFCGESLSGSASF